MNRQDPIVINPLLCYVNNHRKNLSDHDLRSLISRYFDSEEILNAYERLNQQTASILDAINDDREELSSGNVGSVEAILRIFRLCDRYRITLPEFAVTDLKTLPPPPSHKPVDLESPILRDSAVSTVAHSANNSSNGIAAPEKASSDALFTRRMLMKIVKELKQLKSLVIDLSVKNAPQEPTALDESARFELRQEESHPSPIPVEDDDEEEKAMSEHDCPSNNSVQPINSPAPNGDDHKPPSRDSSASISRTTLTPPRKRGSSRSSGSIEDTVAKLKALRGENPFSLIFNPTGQNANADPDPDPDPDPADSCSPSPKTGLDESETTPSEEKSPDMTPVYCDTGHVKNECETLFPSAMAARSLAAAMMEPGLFLSGGVSRMDLVNSAAAMMAASGVFPVAPGGILAAALSPRGPRGGIPPFSTSAPQQAVLMESCFAAPTSTTPCVSPMIRQHQKEPPAIRAGRSTAPRSQFDGQKPKKTAKRQDLASPALSDPDDTKKRQRNEQSDGESSLTESSSGAQGNGTGKPFVCTHDNCDKRFSNKFLLKKHEFIHTGLRPHQCPYCLKKFNRKDNLLRHKVTHEKNYTTPRRRTCRVFGVKGSMLNSSSLRHPDLATTASAGSSPSADSKVHLQQRSSSCAPNENETTTNRQPTPLLAQIPAQQTPAQTPLHSGPAPTTAAEFSLAALASYTALAQSLWPRAALSGVHSMNN